MKIFKLREDFRKIRDGQGGLASAWAGIIVQTMDEIKQRPSNPEAVDALNQHSKVFSLLGAGKLLHCGKVLPAEDIAASFDLGGHQ